MAPKPLTLGDKGTISRVVHNQFCIKDLEDGAGFLLQGIFLFLGIWKCGPYEQFSKVYFDYVIPIVYVKFYNIWAHLF